MLVAALAYVERGWPVFPVHSAKDGKCSCGSAKCGDVGKHPRIPNGRNGASVIPAEVHFWWSKWPDANIGIATGALPGGGHLFVLDIDPRHHGDETLAALEETHGALPETARVLTGGGGQHVYFTSTADVQSSGSRVGEGLDVRARGGYVLAPPSSHESGRAYAEDAGGGFELSLAVLPEWLRVLASRPKPKAQEPADGSPYVEGNRNSALASLAGTMRRRGFGVAAIFAALMIENRGRCRPPLDDLEVRRISEGMGRYQPSDPVSSKSPKAWTPPSIVDAWRKEGPLVHEPTGIARLDELTGGGPVYGTRWYIVGAPDAGKTALLVQIADAYARAGLLVGFLAVDEEPSDVLTRFAQRAGWTRKELEQRDAGDLDLVAERLSELPIRFYDAGWTLDAAATDLAAEAESLGRKAALFVDSIQTVTCDGEKDAKSIREAVTLRSSSLRAVASRHRLIAIATSEMGRHAYRTQQAGEEASDLAAAKESGAIEYSARVLLALRSVAGEPDLVQLRVGKNKHGPSGDEIYLRLDRRKMTLSETMAPDKPDIEEMKAAKNLERATHDAAAMAFEIASTPGIGRRQLEAALRARVGSFSIPRVDVAFSMLGEAVVKVEGARNAVRLFLDGRRVPEGVAGALGTPEKYTVIGSRPPQDGGEL